MVAATQPASWSTGSGTILLQQLVIKWAVYQNVHILEQVRCPGNDLGLVIPGEYNYREPSSLNHLSQQGGVLGLIQGLATQQGQTLGTGVHNLLDKVLDAVLGAARSCEKLRVATGWTPDATALSPDGSALAGSLGFSAGDDLCDTHLLSRLERGREQVEIQTIRVAATMPARHLVAVLDLPTLCIDQAQPAVLRVVVLSRGETLEPSKVEGGNEEHGGGMHGVVSLCMEYEPRTQFWTLMVSGTKNTVLSNNPVRERLQGMTKRRFTFPDSTNPFMADDGSWGPSTGILVALGHTMRYETLDTETAALTRAALRALPEGLWTLLVPMAFNRMDLYLDDRSNDTCWKITELDDLRSILRVLRAAGRTSDADSFGRVFDKQFPIDRDSLPHEFWDTDRWYGLAWMEPDSWWCPVPGSQD